MSLDKLYQWWKGYTSPLEPSPNIGRVPPGSGGFAACEIRPEIPLSTRSLFLCSICSLLVCTAFRADNASPPSLNCCDHLFCKSCLSSYTIPCTCPSPGCDRFLPRVPPDEHADAVVRTFLLPTALSRQTSTVTPCRTHVMRAPEVKRDVVSRWLAEGSFC